MASTRAADVAEVLWELKRAGKIATYSTIARRAGFNPGAGGRTVDTALRTVRQDWPHLQWWRAVNDKLVFEKDSEHAEKLQECGFHLEDGAKDNTVQLADADEHLMTWETEQKAEA